MQPQARPRAIPPSAYPLSHWEGDAAFLGILGAIRGRRLVDKVRAHILANFTRHALGLPGDVAEVGVYRGGTAWLMGRILGGAKTLHLFDTFAGMPAVDGFFAGRPEQQVYLPTGQAFVTRYSG